MQGSIPQTYTIADFLKWNEDNELILNPKFQRGNVWPQTARSYLIDSILHGFPTSQLLIRTVVDRDFRRTIRDVVDGQQRLRTIIAFASDEFPISAKASEEFRGRRYSDLDDESKDAFLGYKLACEQLINASDDDVLEVFVRINSYAVPLNEAELRNARYENDFADMVKFISKNARTVWALGTLSDRERVRMMDQSLIAEIVGFWIYGVTDGGESRINRIYQDLKTTSSSLLPDPNNIVELLTRTADLLEPFRGEPIVHKPHFLMVVAGLMYQQDDLPTGKLTFLDLPERSKILSDLPIALEQLRALNTALTGDQTRYELHEFVEARTTTQRIRSRQVRFLYTCRALAGEIRA